MLKIERARHDYSVLAVWGERHSEHSYLLAKCVRSFLPWGGAGWGSASSRTPVSLFLFLAYFYNLASHEVLWGGSDCAKASILLYLITFLILITLGLLTKWCFWASEARGQWYVFPGEPLAVSSTSYLTCPLPLLFLHLSIPFISCQGTVSSKPCHKCPDF